MSSADDEILIVFPLFIFCSCAQKMDMGERAMEGKWLHLGRRLGLSREPAIPDTRNGSIASMWGVAVN